MKKKRLFFALWPDEPTRSTLIARTSEIARASGGNTVMPQNLHMTLAFLHSVETQLLPCVSAAARRACGQSFDLTLDHLDYWPRAKLLWLGPTHTPGALTALVGGLWQELQDCGFTPEKRPFKPHVTLARKVVTPVHDLTVPPVTWPATSFALVESSTGQKQATYHVLAEWPLLPSSGK